MADGMYWCTMSNLNLGFMLPSTASVMRPFGQIDIQRPMVEVPPMSPTPSAECKRKYDWSEHQDAPIRPNRIALPSGSLFN